ncbi:MAG: hypothetical protein RBU23_07860 [Candidatus Auribacterota bacterium]|jgi:signal transduction histidine kinase|nr:hypothetical protein [Candidatus Auribacterota bacterium]
MKKTVIRNKRKKLRLIDKELQLKYISLLICMVLLTSVVFSAITLYTVSIASKVTGEPLFGHIIPLIFIAIVACIAVTVYSGLLTSHRFMGPLYRLKKSIDELVKGSYGGKISFRENDMKFRLAQVYNELSSALQQRVHDDIAFIDSIKDKVRAIGSEVSGSASKSLKEIELQLDTFKKQKSYYLEQ